MSSGISQTVVRTTNEDLTLESARRRAASAVLNEDPRWLFGKCYVSDVALAYPLNLTGGRCDLGFYCPNTTYNANISFNFYNPSANNWTNFTIPDERTWPSACPATPNCAIRRLEAQNCDVQGLYEPLLCPGGYYCPDPQNKSICPEGYYCITGTVEPRVCPELSMCPEGTIVRRYFGGLVYTAITDVILVLTFVFLKFYLEPRTWKRRADARKARLTLESPMNDISSPMTSPRGRANFAKHLSPIDASMSMRHLTLLSSAKEVLAAGFADCNNGLRLYLTFEGLGLTLPAPVNRTILRGVRGRIRPGRVTAIMGPSGAGKTTFLSVLMGKVQRTCGQLEINGKADDLFRYKKITGYVPQEDTMIRECTVRENILFSARMRLPRSWKEDRIAAYVDAIIEVLGLSECCDTLIGDPAGTRGVSGGQRKRTNIGIELAAAPSAIFLDEPTSGLDSSAALEVCRTLRAIANLGLTVVAVVHQPRLEIFQSFDDLLLLAPGGVTAYIGKRELAIPYFKDLGFKFSPGNNPADELLDFIAQRNLPVDLVPLPTSPSDNQSFDGASLDQSFADTSVKPLLEVTDAPALKPVLSSSSSLAASFIRVCPFWAQPALYKVLRVAPEAVPLTPLPESSLYFEEQWIARSGALLDNSNVQTSPTDISDMIVANTSSDHAVVGAGGSIQINTAAQPRRSSMVMEFDPVASSADRGASMLQQFILCHNRSVIQQYRNVITLGLEVIVCMLAGIMMGVATAIIPELYHGVLKPPYTLISAAPVELEVPSVGFYIALAVGVAGAPAGVLAFGEEKFVFFREAAAGHSPLAYFFAKCLSLVYRITLTALHFVAVFHLFAKPFTPFGMMFIIMWMNFLSVYGLASIVSMVVKREDGALLAVIVCLIAACLCGFGPTLNIGNTNGLFVLQNLSFARWTSEAFFTAETSGYTTLFLVEELSFRIYGYTYGRVPLDLGIAFLLAMFYRCVAFVLMLVVDRQKQR